MTDNYRYTIEGEHLTMGEIVARVPRIKADTVRDRVHRGARTWAALSLPPGIGAKHRRDATKSQIAAQLFRPPRPRARRGPPPTLT